MSSNQEPDRNLIYQLETYFDDFVEKLRTDRLHQVDMDIARAVISQFKRLFELWYGNEMVKQLLEKHLFEEIHLLMADSLQKRSSPIAGSSDENYPQESANSDREYSYSWPSQSTEHSESVYSSSPEKEFWKTCDYDVKIIDTNQSISLFDISKEGTYVSIECNLCFSFVSKVTVTDELGEGKKRFTESIANHCLDKIHKINRRLLIANLPYIRIANERGPILRCTLCDEVHHFYTLMNHYKDLKHGVKYAEKKREKALSVSTLRREYAIPYLDKFFIRIMKNAVRCVLCETDLQSLKVTVSHMQEERHKRNTNIFRFNENFVQWLTTTQVRCKICSSEMGFVTDFLEHCQTRSHQQNINEIATRSKESVLCGHLIDLTDEIFECTICGDTYLGIDAFVWHCQFDHKIGTIKKQVE